MFAKIFALFAMLAVAFAAPSPNPKPQVVYSSGLDYYPSVGYPSVYSPYAAAAPVAYSVPAVGYNAPVYVR